MNLKQPKTTPDPELDDSSSSSSDSTAKTVFSFVDRKKTAEAREGFSTEASLAELYMQIRTLPDTKKKKEYIKKINDEIDNGTKTLQLYELY